MKVFQNLIFAFRKKRGILFVFDFFSFWKYATVFSTAAFCSGLIGKVRVLLLIIFFLSWMAVIAHLIWWIEHSNRSPLGLWIHSSFRSLWISWSENTDPSVLMADSSRSILYFIPAVFVCWSILSFTDWVV